MPPGVSAGGRTGLTAAFVGIFFLLALFFAPLAGMVPAYASSAALLYVACVMARGLAEIDWEDITEYAPAVVTAITMPLTYSIATGIGLGFITYVLAKLVAGKPQEAKPAVIVLAVLFAVKFVLTVGESAQLLDQRLFDREEIAPGETLLERTAQQKSRVKGRHGADLARAGVEGEPAPARLGDAFLDAKQRLRRWAAETDENVGIGKFDLPLNERQADLRLLRRRRAISGWAPRNDVGDVDRRTVEADSRQHAVE